MKIRCPNCLTLYRVEPAQLTEDLVRAQCGRCQEVFPLVAHIAAVPGTEEPAVDLPEERGELEAETEIAGAPDLDAADSFQPVTSVAPAAPAELEATPMTSALPTSPPTTPAATPVNYFGPQDPHHRARHLARALVSDIVAYYPDRLERSRAEGTIREEFREEILKSWEEYVLQVGEDFANETDHFKAALNEILAHGVPVF